MERLVTKTATAAGTFTLCYSLIPTLMVSGPSGLPRNSLILAAAARGSQGFLKFLLYTNAMPSHVYILLWYFTAYLSIFFWIGQFGYFYYKAKSFINDRKLIAIAMSGFVVNFCYDLFYRSSNTIKGTAEPTCGVYSDSSVVRPFKIAHDGFGTFSMVVYQAVVIYKIRKLSKTVLSASELLAEINKSNMVVLFGTSLTRIVDALLSIFNGYSGIKYYDLSDLFHQFQIFLMALDYIYGRAAGKAQKSINSRGGTGPVTSGKSTSKNESKSASEVKLAA